MDMGDMTLVSVDDHVVEPPSMADFMREHLPQKFKDRAPRVIRRKGGVPVRPPKVEDQRAARQAPATHQDPTLVRG